MDRERFERLVNRHKDAVYRQMARVCNNEEDAQDALGTALINAFQAAAELKSDDAFRTWLTTIGKRVCTRMRANPTIRQAFEFAEERGLIGADVRDLELQVLKGCVREAIESLPEIYRRVYEECEIHERTVPEVAREMGLSEAAVKSRLHRARAMVRRTLDRSVCAH